MSDRDAFEKERLVALIIDRGMMRRDVAVDVAFAILDRWRLASKVDDTVWEAAFKTDIANLREKLATAHRLLCEANASLAKTCRGEDADVDKAASTIALAIRLAA